MCCKKCGKEIADDFQFCPCCGAKNKMFNKKTKNTEESDRLQTKGLNKKILALFIGGGSIFILITVFLILFFTHIICFHNWKEADCVSPKTCSICQKTEDEPLGHDFSEATCNKDSVCSRCSEIAEKSIGHNWTEATCTKPKTCSNCGLTDGKEKDHEWKKATCNEPETCSSCGKTKGKALGHKWEEATCTKPEICKKCKETKGKATGHKWSDATYISPEICKSCNITKGNSLLPPDNKEAIFSEGSKYENDGVHLTGTVVNKWILDIDSDGQDELIVHYDTGSNVGDFWDIYEEYEFAKTVWDFGYANYRIELVENNSGNYELCRISPSGSRTKAYPEIQYDFPGAVDSSYSVPVTVTATHGFNTYDENGNFESDHSIGTNDDCYIDAVYENGFVHVNYPVPGGRRWAYAKLKDFNYLN